MKQGWQGLINHAKLGDGAEKLPDTFVQFWISLQEQFQRGRCVQQAQRALLARLTAWEKGNDTLAIPGYARPPKRLLTTGLAGWVELQEPLPAYPGPLPTRIAAAGTKSGQQPAAQRAGEPGGDRSRPVFLL